MASGAPSPVNLVPEAALAPHSLSHGDLEQAVGLSRPASAQAALASPAPPPLDTNCFPAPRPSLGSRRGSYVAQAHQRLSDGYVDPDTCGVMEQRDGFFDAPFPKPTLVPSDEFLEHSKATLPAQFDKGSPLAPKHFLPRQLHEIRSLVRRTTTTRAGIRLLKSFTAYSVAYVLCLVPAVRNWLGRYHYIMVLSVILNHPARSFGSQLEGTIFTIVGAAAGLGWGVASLLLSISIPAAEAGYGSILIFFLAVFMATMAWIRSYFARLYQLVLCAGIALIFTIFTETRSRSLEWTKVLSFAIPWLLGQAIALIVNSSVTPDTGARPLATALHQSIGVMLEALVIPRPRDTRLRRRLARAFVDLSQAYRDMKISLTITRFRPDDVRQLRNLIQATIRALLAMETETALFNKQEDGETAIVVDTAPSSFSPTSNSFGMDGHEQCDEPDGNVARMVVEKLAKATSELLLCMKQGLQTCQAALMDISGHRQHLGPPMQVPSNLPPMQIQVKTARRAFEVAESGLLESGRLPAASMEDPAVVRLFVFTRHIREAASAIEDLMGKVCAMQHNSCRPWPRPPSYPLKKAVHFVNAQVRHDRGGANAGSYHVTFLQIARALDKIKSREYKPVSEAHEDEDLEVDLAASISYPTFNASTDLDIAARKDTVGYKIWRVLHFLQGHDSKYAFKVCLLISLLAMPSYLNRTKSWWDHYEAWWAVAMGWILMHSRVGGNIQDLLTRALAAVLGAVWSGAAYAAGDGNPYVMAVFAAVFMLPMLYRFTQSTHPRSGLVGCVSFTVISLSLQADPPQAAPVSIALLKGLIFLVGTTAPILVNWVLWPFVARHELRKSLSSMMFFMSVIYRNVVAKYIYFQEGKGPTPEDVEKSEVLEGRLREGFVRIRQLLVMTRHELRLRAPFDPLPYSALAESCERFFEYLIAVRQSAVFYNPGYIRDNPAAAQRLLGFRRDAVATILANLYILAGALRSHRKVPRYLPSAAATRKKLLTETARVEAEMAQHSKEQDAGWHKKWSDIYSYSYNESLTGCVAQLEELEKCTKLIVGEQGFDHDLFRLDEDDNDDEDEEDEDGDNRDGVHS